VRVPDIDGKKHRRFQDAEYRDVACKERLLRPPRSSISAPSGLSPRTIPEITVPSCVTEISLLIIVVRESQRGRRLWNPFFMIDV
jgi:hypothetical protein